MTARRTPTPESASSREPAFPAARLAVYLAFSALALHFLMDWPGLGLAD